MLYVTIPAVTPTFSSTSRPAASPEAPRDTSSGHVPLGSHVIHPRAPSSRPMPRDPVSHPRWVRLRESPLSTPDVTGSRDRVWLHLMDWGKFWEPAHV